MANKATSTTCTCHSCDNPYFVRAQIIAKSAGSPAYRFGIDESLTPPTIEIVGFLGGAARFIAKP